MCLIEAGNSKQIFSNSKMLLHYLIIKPWSILSISTSLPKHTAWKYNSVCYQHFEKKSSQKTLSIIENYTDLWKQNTQMISSLVRWACLKSRWCYLVCDSHSSVCSFSINISRSLLRCSSCCRTFEMLSTSRDNWYTRDSSSLITDDC